MPKRRYVTKKEKLRRAKISRSLRRYYREQRERAHRRSLAAKRAAVTRKARRALRSLQQTKEVRGEVAPALHIEEWEVTVKYTVGKGKHHGETVDISLRLVGRPGLTFTNTQVRAAAWYALKHGAGALSEFRLEAIDWYNERRSGKVEEYHYGADDEILENARGIFYTVGIGALRVALVE